MKGNLKELITIIENKVNIVDTVGDYISLEKKGNNSIGLCPFHSDSNPSMSVSLSKGIYKCFVCGAGGGPINFVQNYEGISFIESVKKISEKNDINWKEYLSSNEKRIDATTQRGWNINREAQTFFTYSLNNSKNTKVNEFVKQRDLNSEIISKFLIGFSGEKNALKKYLMSKGFSEEEMILYGLVRRDANGKLGDYFINRIIFTITDSHNNIIGFSGRVIEDGKYSKYLNSPETSLFRKKNTLYNLFNAKTNTNLKKELIVVEGFMDIIALYKSGIMNSVATMGTAFTFEHTKLVKAMTNRVILAFDSDIAGVNALISSGKELIKGKLDVSAVVIPDGKDFDDLYRAGAESVIKTIENKINFLTFYTDKLFVLMEKSNAEEFSKLLKKIFEILSLYNDEFIVEKTINTISKKFDIEKGTLMSKFKIDNTLETQSFQKQNNKIVSDEQNFNQPNTHGFEHSKVQRNLKKEVQNRFSETINRISNMIFLDEELILSYAILNKEAFEYMNSNFFAWHNPLLEKAWNSYTKLKLEGVEISNDVSKKIIETFRKKNMEERLEEEMISNIKGYAEIIERHEQNFKQMQKDKLRENIHNTANEDDKKYIYNMLKSFED